MLRIAVIGAGFAGLASAWHLSTQSTKAVQIDVIDKNAIGGGASGVAAGLLHAFAGAKAKRNWMSEEAINHAATLLELSQSHSSVPVYHKSGLLRLAINQEQLKNFKLCADENKDVAWWPASRCVETVAGISKNPGIYIPNAYTVYASAYLKGLWHACETRGVQLLIKTISSINQLHQYDKIIIAGGAETKAVTECQSLPLYPIKGQILQFSWPDSLPTPPFALSSQIYLVLSEDKKSAMVGSSFERYFTNKNADLEAAKAHILPKLFKLFPALENISIQSCKSGIRCSAPLHRPLLKQLNGKTWILCGLGSKGLLYHSLFAKKLAREVLLK